MSQDVVSVASEVSSSYADDRTRMLDIVRDVQARLGCVPREAFDVIAKQTGASRVDVESVVSFYWFLRDRPEGKVVIRLCDDLIDEMLGAGDVERAFVEQLGVKVGETTADGAIHLAHTPCIGMSDQAPAALVNDVVVTNLTPEKAREIAKSLKADPDPSRLVTELGDGNNAHELVKAMVKNNLHKKGEVLFGEYESGAALKSAVSMSAGDVIKLVKEAGLRGRGGAGFPTGLKWEFTANVEADEKYVICNADEGEPGTFKDRVLLTERADMLFEGMTVAGYAIGAGSGILYLRGEYAYLEAFLEDVLAKRREAGRLGKSVAGNDGFDFDIRIQMGAGAYVCGEETALISSCAGRRGDPTNRPPFPAQKGYLDKPTCVNNVETLCCVPPIITKGASWFMESCTRDGLARDASPIPPREPKASRSAGTKLLSVSGDCARPGVYEVPFGLTIRDMLELVGAPCAAAVQVGGPSGQMITPEEFGRAVCFDDLATGGSIMIFNGSRDILHIVSRFLEFFIEESCGFCTPCRAGNPIMKDYVDRIRAGKATPNDLVELESLAKTVKTASRCGLGQTSPNIVLSTIEKFRDAYESKLVSDTGGFQPTFDLKSAVKTAESLVGRKSVHAHE